jgi:hypothetical protein
VRRCDGSPSEQVIDLADSGARDTRGLQGIQQGLARRFDRHVPSMRRHTLKATWFPVEGSRNHS